MLLLIVDESLGFEPRADATVETPARRRSRTVLKGFIKCKALRSPKFYRRPPKFDDVQTQPGLMMETERQASHSKTAKSERGVSQPDIRLCHSAHAKRDERQVSFTSDGNFSRIGNDRGAQNRAIFSIIGDLWRLGFWRRSENRQIFSAPYLDPGPGRQEFAIRSGTRGSKVHDADFRHIKQTRRYPASWSV